MWTSHETLDAFTPSVALLAVIISFVLSNRAENKRREQDFKRHQSDQAHDHRERLLDVRVETYQKFAICFSEHRDVYKEIHHLRGAFNKWVEKLENPEPLSFEEVTDRIDQARQRWLDSLPLASAASKALEDSVLALELVASGEVLQKATALSNLADLTWKALQQVYETKGDGADIQRWAELRKAEDRLDAGKAILLESIRAELHVEAQQDS